MRPRTTLLDIFSTFIQLAEDQFEAWISDLRLVKSMQQQASKATLDTAELAQLEGAWVLHWYRLWQQGYPRAALHLCAYLQEPCYWAAARVTRRFVTVQYTLADGFQIAIAHTERILQGYNPDYGSNLKAYARTAFGNLIRDQLRQQQEVNICSDWGLLRKLSQTQLKQALLAAGFTQTESPILVWQCFKAICIPAPAQTVRGLAPPSEDQFAHMAQRYNQLRHRLSPVPPALAAPALAANLKQSA
ncbi:MAG: sigma-70 family RNA polymerase sigma factor, partial [Cyanobacteria bacterium P01_F01_bin.4]